MHQIVYAGRSAALCLAVACGLFAGATASADTSFGAATSRTPGITNPSEQRGLNFNVPGVVAKVLVKEGDAVKKGDLVAVQDDTVDTAELRVKTAEAASSKLQIDAAKADLAQKKVELERSEKMFSQKVLGKSELEKAKLDVEIGQIRVDLAVQETSQKQLETEAQAAKVEQRKLKSTIDGIVQKINVHEGELATNDPKTPCMQIVSNQPLYVEVDLPVRQAQNLQLHQKLGVKYMTEGSDWLGAELIYFNPVANAGAGTQRVRLELENPRELRSGLQVEVSLDDKSKKGVAVAP